MAGNPTLPPPRSEYPKCYVVGPLIIDELKRKYLRVVCKRCPKETAVERVVPYNANFIRRGGSLCPSCARKGLRRTHGMHGTYTYAIWSALKHRVKRGYWSMPKHWRTFVGFFRDMGVCPPDKFTLGRIDNEKPYSKKNCRYEDWFEQNNNKSSNRHVIVNGDKLTIAQAARVLKVDAKKLWFHTIVMKRSLDVALKAIRSGKRLLSHRPLKGRPAIKYKGKLLTLAEATRQAGVRRCQMDYWRRKGYSFQSALSMIKKYGHRDHRDKRRHN